MVEGVERDAQSAQCRGREEVYRVCDIQQETVDAVSVYLEPTSSSRRCYQFRSGQYLTLRFEIGQRTCVRCYSLSSAPHEGILRVTVKRVRNGLVSSYIGCGLQVGARVIGEGAYGDFFIRNPDRAFLGVAAGSGITPLISMLKHVLHSSSAACRLLYVTPDQESTIFRDELAHLAASYTGRLEVHHWHTRANGRLSSCHLKQYLNKLAGELAPDVYLCGPEAWMSQVSIAVRQCPERFGRVYQELFGSGCDSPYSSSGLEHCHEVVLESSGRSHTLLIAENQTILAGARAAGVAIASGCEQGKCGSCMAKCRTGEVEPGNAGFLTESELRSGYILCCQARPLTPCVVVTDG